MEVAIYYGKVRCFHMYTRPYIVLNQGQLCHIEGRMVCLISGRGQCLVYQPPFYALYNISHCYDVTANQFSSWICESGAVHVIAVCIPWVHQFLWWHNFSAHVSSVLVASSYSQFWRLCSRETLEREWQRVLSPNPKGKNTWAGRSSTGWTV